PSHSPAPRRCDATYRRGRTITTPEPRPRPARLSFPATGGRNPRARSRRNRMTARPFGGTLRLSLAALAAGVLAAPAPAREPTPWYTSPPPCACPCPWPAPAQPPRMPPADGQPRPPDQQPPDQQPPTEPVSTEQPTEADTGAEQVGATGSEVS